MSTSTGITKMYKSLCAFPHVQKFSKNSPGVFGGGVLSVTGVSSGILITHDQVSVQLFFSLTLVYFKQDKTDFILQSFI